MLTITIPKREYFNEKTYEFIYVPEAVLQLEHSLISIHDWESKWKRPFLDQKEPMTYEEFADYVRCMTITRNVDQRVYQGLSQANVDSITTYINDPMTATTIPERPGQKRGKSEQMTAELIYYYMITFGIPYECRKWHLNKLLMLIKTCEHKQTPPKKMSQKELMKYHNDLNNARRKKYGSKG